MVTRHKRTWRARLWQLKHAVLQLPRKLRMGYYRMPLQRRLINSCQWNVLIVLDACRADYYRRRAPEASCVRSLGRDTRQWVIRLCNLAEIRKRMRDILWVTANPVVDRTLEEIGIAENLATLKVWETGWSRVGPQDIPTVPPVAVNTSVQEYLAAYGQPKHMIIHYVQPHSPYIGEYQLPLAGWGWGEDEMSQEINRLSDPRDAVGKGFATWGQVRRAYESNVELVRIAARDLRRKLGGNVVVTADHGEILGAGGRFGHDPSFCDPELRLVPWHQVRNRAFSPEPVKRMSPNTAQGNQMQQKLRALGYM